MAETLSRLTINVNQETKHESAYKNEILSEINNIEELSEGIFPINLKLINKYQQKDPSLMDKYKKQMYKTGSFIWSK